MLRSVSWLTLDLNKRDVQGVISLGQGETGRQLKFRLFENGVPFVLENGWFVILSGVMGDDLTVYNDCTIDGGVVVYDITDATALNTVGVMDCQLQIMSLDGACICSPKFQIVVHPAVYNKEVVETSNQFFALQNLLGGSSSGGGGVVTVSYVQGNSHPSMTAKEIYDAYQNGMVVRCDFEDVNGVHHLMDLSEPPAERGAVFKKTENSSDHVVSYAVSVYLIVEETYAMGYSATATIPKATEDTLPLSGKNILIFGDDYQYYSAMVDELEAVTGATVYNFGINDTMPGTGHSDELKNAFCLSNMLNFNTAYGNDFTTQETAISNAKANDIDTARYEEVLSMLKDFPYPDFIILSYGKSAYFNSQTLKNDSSTTDTSTFYGGLASTFGVLGLKYYIMPIIATTHWGYSELHSSSNYWSKNDANATMIDYNDTTKQVADDYNFQYIELYKNTGFGMSSTTYYLYSGTSNYFYASLAGQVKLAHLISKELC